MIYVLLPAHNEEVSVQYLLPKIKDIMEEVIKKQYLIIACDDGSTDSTLEKLREFSNSLPVEIIHHKINRGLGETIRDLFERVAEVANEDDIIIRMDCDDTHEPKFMVGLIDELHKGNDVVIASRFVEGGGQNGLVGYRKTLSKMANYFMKFFFPIKGLQEYSSGFRAYRAGAIKSAIKIYGNDFIQLKGLGFTGTLEKIVKLKILDAKFSEAPFVLEYDQKKSVSKMPSLLTTFGYIVLAVLYHWPVKGWKYVYKNSEKLH